MQPLRPDDPFQGGAFHPTLDKGRTSGSVYVSSSGVRFVSDKANMELPLAGLIVELGGANDRLLFFRHPGFSEWAIYTSDHRILEHPSLANARELQGQRSKIKRKKTNALITTLVALSIPILLIASLFLAKNKMVEEIAEQIPASWEQKLGDTVFAQLKVGKRVIDDPKLNKELEKITEPLLKAIKSDRYTFQFHIIEDPELNAFALPGGNVTIHSGLLLRADSPEEVAGVLAHEIAHVTRQHSMRNMIESVGLYAVVQAFLGDATGILAILANNAPFLLRQKFSRDYEREADEQGWDYLILANIRPDGMIAFFKKLKEETEKRRGESPLGGVEESFDFLSTHPATDERIERLEKKREKLGKAQAFREMDLNFKEFQNSLRAQLSPKTTKEEKDK